MLHPGRFRAATHLRRYRCGGSVGLVAASLKRHRDAPNFPFTPRLIDRADDRARGHLMQGADCSGAAWIRQTRPLPKHHFVLLDLPSEVAQAEHEPGEFLRRNPPPVIVDEVQYVPHRFHHLKTLIDANLSRAGSFLLTGSQKFPLMKGVSESRAGRVDVFELETLPYVELRGTRSRARALPVTDLA